MLKEIMTEKMLVEAEIVEMDNLFPDDTGLKYVLWIGEIGGQHGPRIKISNVRGKFAKDNCFVISITKNPVVLTPSYVKIDKNDLNDILDWVKLNYDTLIKLWKVYETGNGNSIELLNMLNKI